MVPQDLEKSINLNANLLKPIDDHFITQTTNEIRLERFVQLLNIPTISILQIFQIHLICKSAVNWLPEELAAGA